jgi:teichuronic acid biosynthesis glycosyltransferase TuaC
MNCATSALSPSRSLALAAQSAVWRTDRAHLANPTGRSPAKNARCSSDSGSARWGAECRAAHVLSVLVVTNMYPDAENPDFGTFVQEQVEGLRTRGVDVDVLIVGGKRRKLSYLGGLHRFRRRMHERQYDVIHAHYVFSGMIARLQRSTPLLVSFHGEPARVVGLLSKWLAPFVDAVTVTSQAHKAQIGRQDAYIVPCGVDLHLFAPMPREEARQRLRLAQDKRLALFAGLVRPEKRVDLIQAAVGLVHLEDEQVELVIATRQPHDMMPLYMNACDVMVLASDYEGSPVVIKEAMACNLPIVSTDVGDVAQVIAGTEGCFICQQDAEDMAQKIKLALARGQRTDGRRAVQSLSSDQTVDSVLHIYEKLSGLSEESHPAQNAGREVSPSHRRGSAG